jgi:hypothetical protein
MQNQIMPSSAIWMRRGRSRVGGMYLVTFSVFGSTLPSEPARVISVNQTVPSLSKAMP